MDYLILRKFSFSQKVVYKAMAYFKLELKVYNYKVNTYNYNISYLVVKVGFSPSLWPQPKFLICHLLCVVFHTHHSHDQHQNTTHNGHAN